jgi:hypothetical protein
LLQFMMRHGGVGSEQQAQQTHTRRRDRPTRLHESGSLVRKPG